MADTRFVGDSPSPESDVDFSHRSWSVQRQLTGFGAERISRVLQYSVFGSF